MRAKSVILAIPLLMTACDAPAGETVPREPPPAAAILMPEREDAALDRQLVELQAELRSAVTEADPEHVLRAEAITDRLMQARRPVDWLPTGYGVEPRLRQIQSLADRVVARLRRGATMEQVRDDIDVLLHSVTDLREQLTREGGGPAPVSLDTLLARADRGDLPARTPAPATGATAATETPAADTAAAPATPRTGGALGTPVRDTIPHPD